MAALDPNPNDRFMDELIIRSLQGNATEAEKHELRAWRRVSASNEGRYRELVRVWEVTGEARPKTMAGPAPSAEEITRSAGEGAAAGGSDDPADATHVLPFRRGRARRKKRRTATRWLARGVAAAALVVLGLGIGQLLPRLQPDGPAFGVATVVTGEAEKATVRLGDGSVVRLAPESRLRVTGGDGGREVWVDGRAFFSVVERDGEPFVVRTRAGRALVLGTRFAVRVRGDSMRLAVVEGSVELSSGKEEVEVEAGEASTAVGGATPYVSAPTEIDPRLDWVGQFLAFQSTPLPQVARELERRYDIQVRILDDSLARRTVTAWFTDQSAGEVLTAICRVADVHCVFRDGVATIEP